MVYPVAPIKKSFQYGAHTVTLETGARIGTRPITTIEGATGLARSEQPL